jgi:hypothetical protein
MAVGTNCYESVPSLCPNQKDGQRYAPKSIIGVTARMEQVVEEAQKFCHGCRWWRPRREFSFEDAAHQALRSQCRCCCRERSRRHYVREKSTYIERNRRRRPLERRAAAAAVLQYLREHACVRSGESDPVLLEFNHLEPESKLANISDLIRERASRGQLAAEIAKCEVLCANCHQRHTISAKPAH